MGLDMKDLLQFLFLSALTLSSAIGCIKKPLDEEENPATIEQVQQALADAWGTADPLTMEPNDFLFQETEQTLENNPTPFFVLQEGITISKKEELPDQFLYTFLYQNRVIKEGSEGQQSTREDHRSVGKADPSLRASQLEPFQQLKPLADDYQMSLGFERFYGLAYACVKSEGLDKYCKEELGVDSCEIQCSNLSVSETVSPLPPLIKEQPNCGGFENCSYRLKKVAFDWMIALKKGESVEKQRVNYSVTLSPDMPFFSRLTEYCFKQLYPVQNQKVLVTTCTKLRNFKRGGS